MKTCNKNNCIFEAAEIDEMEIVKLISNLKDSSAGQDDIKTQCYKTCKKSIEKATGSYK